MSTIEATPPSDAALSDEPARAPSSVAEQAAATTGSGPGWRMLAASAHAVRGALLRMGLWSAVEMLPVAASGWLIAHAADDGFLRGSFAAGMAWLTGLVVATVVGAFGAARTYPALGDAVEPLRDSAVRRVVTGSLARAVAGAKGSGTAVVAQLTAQVEATRTMSANLLSALRHFAFTLVATSAGLLALAPAIAGLVLVPVVAALVGFVLMLRGLGPRARAALLAAEEATAAVGVLTGGLRDVVACGAQEQAAGTVARAVQAQARAERRLARAGAARSLVVVVGTQFPLVVVLVAAPWLVTARVATPGDVLGAVTYVSASLAPALHMLVQGLGALGVQLGVVATRIAETSPEAGPGTSPAVGIEVGAAPLADGSVRDARPVGHRLAVRGLTFAYGPAAEPVVRGLDLTVEPDEHLAVVGPSGIGKSTLAGLLTGMLAPGAGVVELGDVDLATVEPAHRQAVLALIPQEAYVFRASLRENLVYLCADPDAAADRLAATVDALPPLARLAERLGGLDAEVSGPALTEAERQLVALGRVHLSAAAVVVLDEATSHLDPPDEALVEQAFARRPGSLLVIAHRISSALRADRILLVDGTGTQTGTHAELLASAPLYADLVGHWSNP